MFTFRNRMVPFAGAICYLSLALFSQPASAASCCGGGSATSLVLPKFSQSMWDVAVSMENYNGFWDSDGIYRDDPPDTDLNQYRLSLGYAMRLGSRWQAAVVMPYVWNSNQYTGLSSSTRGLGDMTLGLTYEAFDDIKCVWKVRNWQDMVPAIYYGLALTVPTGISPYDNVANSFDITGRGFYRLDANLLLDKTIYPWTATLLMSYGRYLERDVNREYGNYVEPYRKQLGDRFQATASLGYGVSLENMATVTLSLAYAHLQEDAGKVAGGTDFSTEMEKNSVSATLAYANMDKDWIFKMIWSHASPYSGHGRNFPVTDIVTMEVSHVFH
ncbi:MAG TPA: hypothetical protein ENJ11_02520 [Gammaproteobacteria bacterium]|nr:hypothetical protein [Gammaproteobacteria bacterium]